MCESRRLGEFTLMLIIVGFGVCRWNVSNRLQQPLVVEPVHPIQRGKFDGIQVLPGLPMNNFSLVQAVDSFGEGVVPRGQAARS